MIYIADDVMGRTVFINAPSWSVAEQMCLNQNLELVGEHVPIPEIYQQPPLDLTEGDTLQ